MLLAVLALALAPHVAATTVEALDDAALVERSDLIARVVVRSAHAERVGRRVITFYDVDVVEAWRSRDANVPARTVIALPGGVVDGIGQAVSGMPRLEVGKQYVVCLGDDDGPKHARGNARGIVGLWQGAFTVIEGARLRPFTHGAPAADVDIAALRARLTVRR